MARIRKDADGGFSFGCMSHVAGHSIRGVAFLPELNPVTKAKAQFYEEVGMNGLERLQKVEKDIEDVKGMVGLVARKLGVDVDAPAVLKVTHTLTFVVAKGGGMFRASVEIQGPLKNEIPMAGLGTTPYEACVNAIKYLENHQALS